jgi:hypothetical protein
MIRRDIYSVKADVRDGAGMAHVFMTKNRSLAFAKAREIRNDHSLGINRLAKVVHPAEWVVTFFIAAGNRLAT